MITTLSQRCKGHNGDSMLILVILCNSYNWQSYSTSVLFSYYVCLVVAILNVVIEIVTQGSLSNSSK